MQASYDLRLGHSPKTEIDRVRFERAEQLLSETNHKLARIAALLGFSTATQFTNTFKRCVGCTPSQWAAGDTVTRRPSNRSPRA